MGKKTVYLDEQDGDDENDGLSPGEAVRSAPRAIQIAVRKKAEEFDVKGSDGYLERINAELRKKLN